LRAAQFRPTILTKVKPAVSEKEAGPSSWGGEDRVSLLIAVLLMGS
jgi:hypothetical protein